MEKAIQLIGGLFIAGLGGFFLFGVLSAAQKSWRTAWWSKAKGEVIMAWVDDTYDDAEARNFSAEVSYWYEVDGVRYESDIVRFGATPSSESAAIAYTEAYPAGHVVCVYYDPNNPADCVLDRRIVVGSNVYALLWGVLLFGIGVGLVIRAI